MQIAHIDNSSRGLTDASSYADASWMIGYKFDTEKELNNFVSLFPKYCKIEIGGCYALNPADAYEFGASFDLTSRTNKVTGDVNETAEKRIRKIISILATVEGA